LLLHNAELQQAAAAAAVVRLISGRLVELMRQDLAAAAAAVTGLVMLCK
jgi:hypothetical protein